MTTLAGLARPADRNRPSITPYTVVAFVFAMTRGGGRTKRPTAARPSPALRMPTPTPAGVAV